ncbi:hypothetical protein QJS66_13890 [Kocuria rhizophila]|nr:hypothetical protein QJS66_13890 [Kocuria rhizophila]
MKTLHDAGIRSELRLRRGHGLHRPRLRVLGTLALQERRLQGPVGPLGMLRGPLGPHLHERGSGPVQYEQTLADKKKSPRPQPLGAEEPPPHHHGAGRCAVSGCRCDARARSPGTAPPVRPAPRKNSCCSWVSACSAAFWRCSSVSTWLTDSVFSSCGSLPMAALLHGCVVRRRTLQLGRRRRAPEHPQLTGACQRG